MIKRPIFFLIVALLYVATSVAAEEPKLTPQAGRITDATISSDIKSINGLQKRLADVNTQGTPIATYHFAKAQAWIDMAMDEYSMNDRTSVIEDTVREAHGLIAQLEERKSGISMDTPILPTSKVIRPDLWLKAADWKKHPGFPCAEDLVAQLEVQLVWAGHEDNQLGWRHAKPYLQAAERLAKEAERKIEGCTVQLASAAKATAGAVAVEEETACVDESPKCPACPVCAAPQPIIVMDEGAKSVPVETTPDRIHFALNRYIISARSAAVLERVATVLRANPAATIELRGNADERGHKTFNHVLSRQRAEVIKTYLVSAGIERHRITVKAFGMTAPNMKGSDILSYARNRRVEFVFSGSAAIKAAPQYEDVQVEKRP